MNTQPAEDIEAVLGRFEAWTGKQNAVEVKPGIRELSHEEALESAHSRWRGAGRTQPAQKAAPEPAAATTAPKPSKAVRATKAVATKKVRARKHSAKSAKASSEPQMKPAFREVLAQTVKPTAIVTRQAADQPRQAAISIRFAADERALIKARAEEAGLTASAYIRQCALEVEQLRTQVQHMLASMEIQPCVAASSRLSLFARLRQRIFPVRSTAIALQA